MIMKKLFSLLFLLCVSVISYAQIIEAVHWRFSVKDISDSEKELVFTANMDDGWHLYGMNIPDGGPAATTFSFDEIHGAVLDGGVTSSSRLIKKYDKQFEMELSWYEKQAVFIQKIKLTAPTFSITGNVRAMACNDQSCLPPTTEEFTFTGKGTPAEATKPESLQKENIKATVVMVSTLTTDGAEVTLKAMERGAIDFIEKPNNLIETKGQRFREKLIKVLATITAAGSTQTYQKKVITNVVKPAAVRKIRTKDAARSKIVAIACSTGGPKSLQSVIPLLKSNMDAPVLVVQHMPAGFTKSMAARLNELSPLDVKEANEGDVLEKGHVYVAPGGKHLLVQRLADGTHCIVLSDAPAIGGLRPCANLMYESLMDSGYDEITCVVLTGMGADGTKGISELQKEKNVYVIAQDEETSVVYGMPKAIAETGLVDEIVPLESVADTILKNVGVN